MWSGAVSCAHVVLWPGSLPLFACALFLTRGGCRMQVCAITLFVPAKGRGAGESGVERGGGSCVVLVHVTVGAKGAEAVALPRNSARRHQEAVVELRARARVCVCVCVSVCVCVACVVCWCCLVVCRVQVCFVCV